MSAADAPGAGPVPLLRVEPALVDTVAQLLWAAAPQAQPLHDEVDEAGLVPLYLRAPLGAAEAAAFERGLDALLSEASERALGTYLREVRDLRGRRRELARPCDPAGWNGRPGLVGPFVDEAAARGWAAGLPAGWFGDALPHAQAWYVDVFASDDDTLRALSR